MVVSEIRAQYIDENDLFRTVIKRIYEVWDADTHQWTLKKIEFDFVASEYPGATSEVLTLPVEMQHGWVIPPAWTFSSEVWQYSRKPITEPAYDHTGDVMFIRD